MSNQGNFSMVPISGTEERRDMAPTSAEGMALCEKNEPQNGVECCCEDGEPTQEAAAQAMNASERREDENDKRIKKLKDDIRKMRGEKDEAEYRAFDLEGKLNSIKGKYDSAEERIKELNAELSKYRAITLYDEDENPIYDPGKYKLEIRKMKHSIETLEKEKEEYHNLYSSQSGSAETDLLKEMRKEINDLREQKNKVEKENHALQSRVSETKELEEKNDNLRYEIDRWKQVYEEFKREIAQANAYFSKNKSGKFAGIKEYAENLPPMESRTSSDMTSLFKIAQHIKEFGESGGYERVSLRFSKETICAFLAGLGASEERSHLLLLQGLSGTGKSSLPQLVAAALGFHSELIPVQPSWRDRYDLIGFDNDFKGVFKETEFTKAIWHAAKYKSQPHFIILDECNLARIEYYFADFLSILEKAPTGRNSRKLDLAPVADTDPTKEYRYLEIPENLWFVGTANIDESTQSITDKVYDRAQVLTLNTVPKKDETPRKKVPSPQAVSFESLKTLFGKTKEAKEHQMSEDDLKFLNDIMGDLEKLEISFGERVRNQLQNYVPIFVAAYCEENAGPGEAVTARKVALDSFIANKLLKNKLEKRFSIDDEGKEICQNIKGSLKEHLGKESQSFECVDRFLKKYGG